MPGCPSSYSEEITSSQRETLAWRLSDGMANRYAEEVLAPALGANKTGPIPARLREVLDDPSTCLRLLFERYAFARRGKDKRVLSELAITALSRWTDETEGLERAQVSALWEHFADACRESGRRPQEDVNHGVITGLAALCQGYYREKGQSLSRVTADVVMQTHRIEPIFFEIVGLKGVGPKFASTMLRDWAYAYEFEPAVTHRDTIYLQPIDRWTRLAGPWLIEEPGAADYPDWILAGKLGKAARSLGLSGVRINMGLNWLGQECHHMVQPEPVFQERLAKLSQAKSAGTHSQSRPA